MTALNLGPRLSPAQLRRQLERLGPTFVKIGQYLALRPDVIDQAYCDELMKLVEAVPAEPIALTRQTIEADLGRPLADAFAWFSQRPVGAGSLAQVYHARTHDGAEVAVKVQRADARERVDRDLRRLRRLVPVLRRLALVPAIDPGEVVRQIERWMADELDPELERRNLVQLAALSHASRAVLVPDLRADLSGGRVTTTSYLAGIPLSQVLRDLRADRPDRLDRAGLDRDQLAERLIRAALEQIFRYKLFHADMHPGNLIALPGNRIGFVDFGLCETLDPTLQAGLFRYVRAIYLGDVEEMLQGLKELLIPGPNADFDAFSRAFREETRRMRRERQRGSQGAQSAVGRYLIGVLRAARQNDFALSPGVLALYRSLLTAERVAYQLGGTADLGTVGKRFFVQMQLEQLVRVREPDETAAEVLETVDIVRDLPKKLDRIVSELAADRFRLRVEQSGAPADRRLTADAARLIALAVVWTGTAALAGLAGERALGGGWVLADVLWPALGLGGVWLALLWRRLP